MTKCSVLPKATVADEARSLANEWFDILNGTSNHKYFVLDDARDSFISAYVGFIEFHGAEVFAAIASGRQQGDEDYANNPNLLKTLREFDSVRGGLGEYGWIGKAEDAPALIGKTLKCKHGFAVAKARYIDQLDLDDEAKLRRFIDAIETAIASLPSARRESL